MFIAYLYRQDSMPFYPRRKPYRSGFFPVTDSHELYFALYGNPRGIPVLFVHGGPGAGCGKNAHRFFDPKKFNILALDQRGAGKSRPFAEIRGNTTQKLVKDIQRFLRFLGIKKCFLFGGSWGSTLSLCYCIQHPGTVAGMLLRGIYLGTRAENDYLVKGGPATHFPDVWDRFCRQVPLQYRSNPAVYYWKKMMSPNKKTAYHYCREWSLYESSMLNLDYNSASVLKNTKGSRVIALSRLEASYILNDCFLPPQYIIKNVIKKASQMRKIPATILHGRYDFVCPPSTAYALHKAMPHARFSFVTSGHSGYDPALREALISSFKQLTRKARLSSVKGFYIHPPQPINLPQR